MYAYMNIRKVLVNVEATHIEGQQAVTPPTRKAVAAAVIKNPFAGQFRQDLGELVTIGEKLGELLGAKAVAALGVEPADCQSYGKAAMIGSNGELEHGAAILHPKFGAPLRKTVGKGAALVPSNKKMGGCGQALDVPLGHKDAAYVRSHFDGIEVRISDAPRADEIVVAVAVTDSGRPLARVGGLTHEDAIGKDGLR